MTEYRSTKGKGDGGNFLDENDDETQSLGWIDIEEKGEALAGRVRES